jgi:hypothetical protein
MQKRRMYAQSIRPRSCREGRSAREGPGVARPTSSTRMREARTSMASLLMLAEWALGAEQVRVPASTRRGTRMEVRVRKEASVCLVPGIPGCAQLVRACSGRVPSLCFLELLLAACVASAPHSFATRTSTSGQCDGY